MRRPRQFKGAVVIGGAAAVLFAAGVVFVNSGLASNATPAPTRTVSHTAVGCLEPAIVLTGAINSCAGFVEGLSCPTGPFDVNSAIHLRGAKADFILYVQVTGPDYHGAGTYELAPWPHDTLEPSGGGAKVAVREWTGGRLWESVRGSLTIDDAGRDGSVDADLVEADSGSDAVLHIHGPWTCP